MYYGWIVVAVTSLTLIVSSGIRSAPGVMLHPIHTDFGWSRAAVAFAASLGLLLFGLAGPFAGRLMDRFGPRRVMLAGMAIAGAASVAAAGMTTLWQLNVLWGVFSGIGTGMAAAVLGATVASRWFVARRGLVLGMFGAATSAGQLLFVPLLMWLVVAAGWRAGSVVLGVVALLTLIPILLLMRNEPGDLGLEPLGGTPPVPASPLSASHGSVMARALRTPEFWLLAGSFFVCGATSNGLIGTHLIPHSIDHGIPEVTAAGALALMGAMNFAGTLGSGWLTDRFDPRRLLAVYYTLRGLSLFVLPLATDFSGLAIFAVVFGLDYIATVPPTSALVADIFGRRNVGTVFGWVFFSHQVGAALAAFLGGVAREALGDYTLAFLVAGTMSMMGGIMATLVRRHETQTPVPVVAAGPALVSQ